MKIVYTAKTGDGLETLRYAYAFMKCELLNIKECSFYNPTAKDFVAPYILPRDTFSASYNDSNLPSWEEFKNNSIHKKAPAFTCVASIDKQDKKRVMLSAIGDGVICTCYGNYEAEARLALQNVLELKVLLK